MTISEVAKIVSLTPVTLRYYERVGLLPQIKRTKQWRTGLFRRRYPMD